MRTGVYGPEWTQGVLAEHLRSTDTVMVLDAEVVAVNGDDYEPVLCGELVELRTEDGPMTGRCGAPIFGGIEGFACEGHTRQIEGWRAQSELETIAWERRESHG